MNNMQSIIGTDLAAEFLRQIREQLGEHYPDWREIEPIVYEAIKEFEELPPINVAVSIPGAEPLTQIEKETLGKALSDYLRDYGSRCRLDMLKPLVVARVRVAYLEKSRKA